MRGLAPALVAEAVGTFLFFFIAAGAALAATGDPAAVLLTIALAHGVVLAVLVSSFGAVSGGHFNPAVTLGLWVAGKVDLVRGGSYFVAQMVAAAAAGYALVYVFTDVAPAVPALGAGVDVTEGIILEAIMTMVLLFAVFGTAVDARGPKIGGLAIGFAVAADILLGGTLTGAAMNPARWFGPALAAGDFSNWYVWWIGPFAGAIIVALLYRFLLSAPEEVG
ncbi:MAG TPA: aquaporin [Candidatus Limnocylindria bacterium]|jgi:MIP family channel proteins|nr:aquaporin [Candidatus Limnocylindria bacterium]